MPVLNLRRFAASVTAGLLVLTPSLAAGQGRGAGHAKPSPPVQAGKPALPPGQAKQPPAAGAHGAARSGGPMVVQPALAAKLQPLLPAGTTLESASAGFKNLGQFVAALHVSKNLDVPFTSLKTQMVDNSRSLGAAIQTLKPGADAKKEASRAQTQSKADIESAR